MRTDKKIGKRGPSHSMALLVSDECFTSQKKSLFGNVDQGQAGMAERGMVT
jgi:hypothetical protein